MNRLFNLQIDLLTLDEELQEKVKSFEYHIIEKEKKFNKKRLLY